MTTLTARSLSARAVFVLVVLMHWHVRYVRVVCTRRWDVVRARFRPRTRRPELVSSGGPGAILTHRVLTDYTPPVGMSRDDDDFSRCMEYTLMQRAERAKAEMEEERRRMYAPSSRRPLRRDRELTPDEIDALVNRRRLA